MEEKILLHWRHVDGLKDQQMIAGKFFNLKYLKMKQNGPLKLYGTLYDTLYNHSYLEGTFEKENICCFAKKCPISVVAVSTVFKH